MPIVEYGNRLRWVYAFTYNPKDFVSGKSYARAIICGVPGKLAWPEQLSKFGV
jgi:hypothetical protein